MPFMAPFPERCRLRRSSPNHFATTWCLTYELAIREFTLSTLAGLTSHCKNLESCTCLTGFTAMVEYTQSKHLPKLQLNATSILSYSVRIDVMLSMDTVLSQCSLESSYVQGQCDIPAAVIGFKVIKSSLRKSSQHSENGHQCKVKKI